MSRVLDEGFYENDTYQKLGPIKWMSPEQLRTQKKRGYGFASDTYSYAMLLYELVSGQLPWTGLDNIDAAIHVCQGERPTLTPDKRDAADALVLDVMQRCWKQLPDDRCKMSEVVDLLSGTRTSLSSSQDDSLQREKEEREKEEREQAERAQQEQQRLERERAEQDQQRLRQQQQQQQQREQQQREQQQREQQQREQREKQQREQREQQQREKQQREQQQKQQPQRRALPQPVRRPTPEQQRRALPQPRPNARLGMSAYDDIEVPTSSSPAAPRRVAQDAYDDSSVVVPRRVSQDTYDDSSAVPPPPPAAAINQDTYDDSSVPEQPPPPASPPPSPPPPPDDTYDDVDVLMLPDGRAVAATKSDQYTGLPPEQRQLQYVELNPQSNEQMYTELPPELSTLKWMTHTHTSTHKLLFVISFIY